MKLLRRNNMPFFVLTIIHSVLFIVLFNTKNKRHILSQLLTNSGFAYLFEFLVLNTFRAYEYYPRIFHRQSLNNIFGAVLSQAVFVPIVSTFLTIYQLGWKWKLFFTIYFSLIEKLFIHLKVFRNRWWRTSYTFIMLLVHFYMSDYWYKLMKKPVPLVKGFSTFLTLLLIHVNILFVYTTLDLVRFGYNKFNLKEHFIVDPLYSLVQSVGYTAFAIYRNPYVRIPAVLLILLVDGVAAKWRFIRNKSSLYVLLPLHAFMLLIGRKLHLQLFKK